MKKAYLLFILSAFIVSCSDDDSDNNTGPTPSVEFFPSASGDYWVYDVPGTLQDGRDSLYVANDTVIGSNTYKKFKTGNLATGFFTGALSNNGVRYAGGKIMVSGTTSVNFAEEFPLNVGVSDFVIFKYETDNNEILDNETGTIEEVFDNYPVELNYSLTTKAKEDLATYTVNGQQYANVKQVETTLELEIVVMFDVGGIQVPFTILDEQPVMVSRQYYAENIGVVHVVTDVTYELNNVPGYELPMPQTGSEHQEEILVDYNVE
jgi:hypothetical protein